ncbi:MAG TPA: OmpH family outer membrane protein, partial [Bacteroidia bacterium]|nr:OmpH family outer membrane protein [Bacteroidia bacterium]
TKVGPAAVAHIDLDSLLQVYPAYNAAMDSAQTYYKQLEQQMYTYQLEYQSKAAEYDSLSKSLSPFQKQAREKDLQDLQQRIQDFQTGAQEDFTNQRAKYLQPVYKSIQKAVKEVAVEKGYKYVLDSSESSLVVLYAAPSDDIFQAVKAKLGIKDTPPAPKTGGSGAPTPPPGPGH